MACVSHHPSLQIRPDGSKVSRDGAHLKTELLSLFAPILSFGSLFNGAGFTLSNLKNIFLDGKSKRKIGAE